MSQACYNPEEAVRMWERMSIAQKNAPPQFLSPILIIKPGSKRFWNGCLKHCKRDQKVIVYMNLKGLELPQIISGLIGSIIDDKDI